MPLNAGDAGYGSVSGTGFPAPVAGTVSETAPLLIPESESEPEPAAQWQPLTKEQLEMAAGGPWWRRFRCYLVLMFWLGWMAMLAVAVTIIVMSPRPVVTPLKWWQKTLFIELQPIVFKETKGGAEGINALCEQLPFLSSLGFGALILQGLFSKQGSASNLTTAGPSPETRPQIQHLLTESNKAGLKVVLDLCGVDLDDAKMQPINTTNRDQKSLRFWLEQGVAGFVICDTDTTYSEKVLMEWRGAFTEFSREEEEERILVVKQTHRVLPPLDSVDGTNQTLVDVVMKSVLPSSHHLQSAQEVAVAIETHLQPRDEKTWPSWTVGGESPHYLKRLLLLLTMTLPGTPALRYDEVLDLTQGTDKERKSAATFFTSLSRSRAREEALMYGSFTFLPFNTTNSSNTNSTLASSPSSPTTLAFLRSWGCVHFLILLNIGPDLHALDPAWAQSLPEGGVFVTSTGLDRLGSTSLYSLVLQPHEAIVIKLFEARSYS